MLSINFKKILPASLVVAAAVLSLQAAAHTPYFAPTSFEPVRGNIVTLDASFAEGFFVPEAAFSDSVFQVIAPDGQISEPDTVARLKTRVAVEHELGQEGTYRLTTGARYGATFLFYEVDGEKKREMNPKGNLPKGAKVLQHFQSVTRADTYVSQKAPSNGALKVESEGLQVLPLDNPNQLFADERFQVKLLMDNQPMADQTLLVYPATGEEEPTPFEFATDDSGVASLNLPAGKYLLRARHRAPAPKEAGVPTYSHTTTLSFQVFENI